MDFVFCRDRYELYFDLLGAAFHPLLSRYVSAAGRMAVCRDGNEVADVVSQDGFYRLFLLAKECQYSFGDSSSSQ